MKIDSRHTSGKKAEVLVLEHFLARGYRFLESRFKTRLGEIDLILIDVEQSDVVFVEVKWRERGSRELESWVSRRQLERIRRTADLYLLSRQQFLISLGVQSSRIDVFLMSPVERTHLKDVCSIC